MVLTEIGWLPFLINSSGPFADGDGYNYTSLHSERTVQIWGMCKVTFLSPLVYLGLVVGKRRKDTAGQMCSFTPLAARAALWPTCVVPCISSPQRLADSVGAEPESLCLVVCDTAGRGRRLILSLFKITSTHWAESLERHCLGFCISLKNTPLQSFPRSEACPFPHSGPLKRKPHGSRAQLLPVQCLNSPSASSWRQWCCMSVHTWRANLSSEGGGAIPPLPHARKRRFQEPESSWGWNPGFLPPGLILNQ